MDSVKIQTRLEKIWRSIAQIDAKPTLKIPLDDPNARQIAETSLAAYVGQEEVFIDSAALVKRPIRIHPLSPADVFALCSYKEFVVLREDEPGYWAITEEEYEWFVFTADEEKA